MSLEVSDLIFSFKGLENIDEFKKLSKIFSKNYKVRARFYPIRNCCLDKCIRVNNKILAIRNKKFSKVHVSKDVKLIEGEFEDAGGSNNHPAVTLKTDFVELEFDCKGLPLVRQYNGFRMEVIKLYN